MSVSRKTGSVEHATRTPDQTHPRAARGPRRARSAAKRPSRGALGNTAGVLPVSARAQRWGLRDTLHTCSTLEAVRKCGRVPVMRSVTLRASAGGARAGYGGLATCGSVWACPVCAAKIATKRREEVAKVTALAAAQGLHVSMLTLTQRHHQGQRLASLWDALSYAWNRVASGRRWIEFREQIGLIGTIRAVEVTHGRHGWHVHTHVLVISEKDPATTPILYQRKQGRRRTPYPIEVTTASAFVADRWARGLAARGVDFIADRGGIDWQTARDAAAMGQYVSKIGQAGGTDALANEATLGALKQARGENRTPFQILADVAATGDADDLRLWHQWEKGSHGRRALLWSHGLREWARLGREQTDEEIAEEETGDEVIAVFAGSGWAALRAAGAAELLDVTEGGGHSAAYAWLEAHGVPYTLPPPPDGEDSA